MKINKIDIKNFRCYKNIGLEFGDKCTVLIGKNGSGKSSIISALRKGLSFVFSENKGEINPLKSNNNATVRSFSVMDTRYDDGSGFNWPTSLRYEVTFDQAVLQWEFYKKGDPGGLHSTLYRDARNAILDTLKKNTSKWPLLAFFGDSYPHHEMNFGKKASKVIKSDTIPRDFAYYGWDEYQNCNILWFERFKYIDTYLFDFSMKIADLTKAIQRHEEMLENQKAEGKLLDQSGLLERQNALIERRKTLLQDGEPKLNLFNSEKKYIEDRMIKFTGPASEGYPFINKDFAISSVSTGKIVKSGYSIRFDFARGVSMPSETLPMGYKRLFHIVFDLAYRAYILTKGEYEPRGVVMIDEVELHLHPTLQQEVIHRFQQAFPEIQFIFSTHSPLVITNFLVDNKHARLIKLQSEGDDYSGQYIGNIYGMDYATGLEEVMGAKPRKVEMDNLIDSIVILLAKDMKEKAEHLKKELFKIAGDNNPYIEEEIRHRVQLNRK